LPRISQLGSRVSLAETESGALSGKRNAVDGLPIDASLGRNHGRGSAVRSSILHLALQRALGYPQQYCQASSFGCCGKHEHQMGCYGVSTVARSQTIRGQ